MLWAETVRRAMEVPREILYNVDVCADSVLGVVTSLELIQHQIPESGHSNLLVPQTLHGRKCWGRVRASGAKALVELDTLRGILNALSVLFAQGLIS
jgi:hypothetical protein